MSEEQIREAANEYVETPPVSAAIRCGDVEDLASHIKVAYANGFRDALIEIGQSTKDAYVLNIAKGLLSKDEFDDVKLLIDDSVTTSDYSIEDEPKGEYQKNSDYPDIKGYFVNQTTNGGYAGDEYAGTISVNLSNGKYLQFHYSM